MHHSTVNRLIKGGRANMFSKKNNIAIIAFGGGASNMLNTIIEEHPELTSTMVVNRDKTGLKRSLAVEKIHLKADTEKQILQEVEHYQHIIYNFIKDRDGLILLTCLGGLTGSYAAAPIAVFSKKLNIETLAITTFPFDFEGVRRREQAEIGQKALEKVGITIATLPNQRLSEIATPDTSMLDAFKQMDKEILKKISPYLIK
jgi:cell division protein FtsZ